MKKQTLLSGIAASAGMLILILDSRTALMGARQAIELCLCTVIPSLFPFFLLSALITSAFWGSPMFLLAPVARLFRIPSGAESLLIPAFLGGYPMGAQCIRQAVSEGSLPRREALRLLAFCSNAGPSFIFGIAGGMFDSPLLPWRIWAMQFLSALAVSLLIPPSVETVQLTSHRPTTVVDALTRSINAMAKVCGWVLLFRVLTVFLERWFFWLVPGLLQTVFSGFLELAGGCAGLRAIESESARFVAAGGMLSFGGICVAMQTVSLLGDLPSFSYWAGKILQLLFCTLFSLSLTGSFPWLIPVIFGILFLFSMTLQNKSSNSVAVRV